MKFDALTAKDLTVSERIPEPVRDPKKQAEIIRSYYERGTEAEKVFMDSILGRNDVPTVIKDMIQMIRRKVEGNQGSSKVDRLPFQVPEAAEAE
jgi:hypothetical protein